MAASIEVENRVLSEWANLQGQADRIESTAAAKVATVSQELKATNAALNKALNELQNDEIDGVRMVIDGQTYWLKRDANQTSNTIRVAAHIIPAFARVKPGPLNEYRVKHPESSVVDALEHAILEELKGHPDTYSRTSFVKLDRRPLTKICAGNEALKKEPVVVDASPELVQLARTKLDQQKEKAKVAKARKAAKQRADVKRNGVPPEAVRAVMASLVSRGKQAIHLQQPDGSCSKLVASQSVRKPTINMTKWEREGLLRSALEAAVEAEVVDPTECLTPAFRMKLMEEGEKVVAAYIEAHTTTTETLGTRKLPPPGAKRKRT